MTAPKTKAQDVVERFGRLLSASAKIPAFTVRVALREIEGALRDSLPEERGALFALSGLAHRALGEFEKAIDALKNAERYNPNDAGFISNIGTCLCDLKQAARGARPL